MTEPASRPLIHHARDLTFALPSLPERPPEVGVVMADPAYFDVEYVINAHMVGNIGTVDQVVARAQWQHLGQIYAGLGYQVHVLDAVEGLPDLVFTANQSFPARLPTGQWAALMSFMHASERRREVAHVAEWYRGRKAHMVSFTDADAPFEGMGDALWIPGKQGIIAGFGFRTAERALNLLTDVLDVPVLALRLVDERFYHLDTCLSLLDDRRALWVPEAFAEHSRALLRQAFDTLIEVPMTEAVDLLACNGHSPDGDNFIVQRGATHTNAAVSALGLNVIEVDTSEFLKSGGSVFCMKLMLP